MADTTEPDRVARFEVNHLRLPMWLCELVGNVGLLWAFWACLTPTRVLKQPLNPADVGAGGFPMLLGVIGLLSLVLLIGIIVVRRIRSSASRF